MITKTAQVARRIAGPNATIFNDKLKDGRRSLKVWGQFSYGLAADELRALGCEVKIVRIKNNSPWRGGRVVTRLHVKE